MSSTEFHIRFKFDPVHTFDMQSEGGKEEAKEDLFAAFQQHSVNSVL